MKKLLVLPLILVGCATTAKQVASPVAAPAPVEKISKQNTYYVGCMNTYMHLANIPVNAKDIAVAKKWCLADQRRSLGN